MDNAPGETGQEGQERTANGPPVNWNIVVVVKEHEIRRSHCRRSSAARSLTRQAMPKQALEGPEWERAVMCGERMIHAGVIAVLIISVPARASSNGGECFPHQTAKRAASGLAPGAGVKCRQSQKGIGTGSGSHTRAVWQCPFSTELSMRADR